MIRQQIRTSTTLSRKPRIFNVVSVWMLAIALLMLPAIDQAKAWNMGKIKWMSYSSGMKKAAKTGKPVIVIFEAKWCQICKRYKKVFYNKQVVRLAKKLVMVRVNIERNRKLQAQHSVDGGYIPRTMAFSPKGYHYADIKGKDPEFNYFLNHKHPGDLIRMMKRALSHSSY